MSDCEECLEPIEEEDQHGCIECGTTFAYDDRCPDCGRFAHRCIPEEGT